ncbi:hypothetical protein BU23DRAFT_661560 [Bimuria novae-zelandiae CBS 107.79]|uniref:Uncharacterized protein n=1 Tax=Bimuria novae-zelandiae CBS 107.79 TaxID=1447943 RepID=A0A6A5UQ23_9PLEO|nr:hypothetical protein BU23DRAFT_661560 [Bimuria novae-zelandiae CBS 107.79]
MITYSRSAVESPSLGVTCIAALGGDLHQTPPNEAEFDQFYTVFRAFSRPKMPHSGQYDLPTRAAIVTLVCEGRGWTYISSKVATVSPNGAQQFFQRLLERVDVSPTQPTTYILADLLKHLEDEGERGREERFGEHSDVANFLVNKATQDEEREELSHRAIIRIAKDELDERIPQEHQTSRLLFIEWALAELQFDVIFIFTDETSVETTLHRKNQKVSMHKGDSAFAHTRPPPTEFKSVMFWGAICRGFRPGSFYIWEKETPGEALRNELVLYNINAPAVAAENHDRAMGRVPGTRQYRALKELNNEVNHRDNVDPLPSGRRRR